MAEAYVKFRNDQGLAEIGIGVIAFECIGASPPDDHPHTYHAIDETGFVRCLYCNTKYVFCPGLGRSETDPPGNSFDDQDHRDAFSGHSELADASKLCRANGCLGRRTERTA